MNNQMIDGVPRDLLEKALRDASTIRFPTDWQVVQLRALLEAPIPFPGYPPVPEDRKLPAAQPQGEPVAWTSERALADVQKFGSAYLYMHAKAHPDYGEEVALYRQQPEQVAVREFVANPIPDDEIGDEWTKGYEECKRRVLALISAPGSTK